MAEPTGVPAVTTPVFSNENCATLSMLVIMTTISVPLPAALIASKSAIATTVSADTVVAIADLEAIKAAGKGTEMVVIITNMDKVAQFSLEKTGVVTAGTPVGSATAN